MDVAVIPAARRSRQSTLKALRSIAAADGVDIRLHLLPRNKHATMLWDHPGPEVWIEWLEATHRGAGAKAMARLIAAADKTNTVLRAIVDDGSDRYDALHRFYRAFGFQRDPAGGDLIERAPRSTAGLANSNHANRHP